MKLKILIAEDKDEELETSIRVCTRLAEEQGFIIAQDSITRATTVQETISQLRKVPFDFDIIVLDIGFGTSDLEVDDLAEYLKEDTLSESKVIIHSGNAEFKTNANRILSAICNGAKTIAIKGETGVYSFEVQFSRVLRDIKFESVWANIGRFTPQWKRNLFRKDELWKDLKKGRLSRKAFLLADISNSTQFVISQRTASIDDSHILELFKTFANNSTRIIEKDCYQGIVERYSGDEVLAYFDMDQDASEACGKAILAALEISENFDTSYAALDNEYRYADVYSGQNIVKPQLRILISCGEVMWVLQGSDSRPQLSIMTDKVAKSYRTFTHRDKNYHRTILPNNIYITHDVFINVKHNKTFSFETPTKVDLRDFGKLDIYNLKK